MFEFKLPVGKYYIGDPCYIMKKDIYHDFWGKENNFKDGMYTINGNSFVVHRTRYGDGTYDGHYGSYSVDSGTLSIVHESFFDEKEIENVENLGMIKTFNSEITFKVQDYNFTIISDYFKEYISTMWEGDDYCTCCGCDLDDCTCEENFGPDSEEDYDSDIRD